MDKIFSFKEFLAYRALFKELYGIKDTAISLSEFLTVIEEENMEYRKGCFYYSMGRGKAKKNRRLGKIVNGIFKCSRMASCLTSAIWC